MSQRYFDWTTLPFTGAEFAERRQKLFAALAPAGGTLLLPSRYHLSDGFTFRQLDDFYYFCGLELPDSVLALQAQSDTALLFVPERDPRFDNPGRPNDFPGRPLMGDPELAARSGLDALEPFSAFEPFLADLVSRGEPLWVNPGRGGLKRPPAASYFQAASAADVFRNYLSRRFPDAVLRDAFPIMARLRMVKSAAEIALMRQACAIAMTGIRVSAAAIRPGVSERELAGIFEAECKRLGAQRLPFATIVKSGPNTLWPWRILASHYDRRNRQLEPGELVVYDVGCELDYYGSDMGRTFPVDGQFSPVQTDVLALQLGVLEAMIGAMRPGVTLAEVQAAGEREIPAGAAKYMSVKPFFGHHIGLSMGDPSLLEAELRPGMIITVEPWYYNHDDGIGTFIEDVVLITAEGSENLTAGLPRTAAGMAALVGG